jgi:hypothetical protein
MAQASSYRYQPRSIEMKNLLILLFLLTCAACAPTSTVQVIGSATSLPQCPCPSGVFPPGPSQDGSTVHSSIICNCPANLLPPTISATEVGPTSPARPSNITLDDNGKTFILHPGDSFLLDLGTDVFDWTVTVDDPNVLSRIKNVMVIRGAQGLYEANTPGQTSLTATGDPLCRNSVPACAAPSMQFKITVIVQ